jgi:cytochrome P450/glutathione S-transferase
MISARISPMVELARWLFELQGVPYAEEPHAPILHVLFTRWAGGGNEIPVVVSGEGLWDGGPAVVKGLAEKAPPTRRLIPDDPRDHEDQSAFIAFLFGKLLRAVRRHVYFQLLPFKSLIVPVVTEGAPTWERLFVEWLYPLWRSLMARGLDFDPALIEQAPHDIETAFKAVEARIAAGAVFMGGASPNTLDIVFAALAAPVIFPAEYGAMLPRMEEIPPTLREYIEAQRARPAGRLVLETYRVARGTPQAPLRFKPRSRQWLSPSLVLFGARALLRFAPRLAFGKYRFFAGWADVKAVLGDDVSFKLTPSNATRMNEVSGDFILGMNRGPRLLDERGALYAAFASVDLGRARRIVETEGRALLDAAAKGGGKIDVVNGYARLVAARTAVALFGVTGPSEPDLMRATRAIFSHTFLNLGDDVAIRDRAIEAGKELSDWISTAIAERRSRPANTQDLLGALLARAAATGMGDDDMRRALSGMIVGAIDTTATAVANIVAELLKAPALIERVAADIDDEERMRGWCWELLRLRPHNPILLRATSQDISFDGLNIKAGVNVIAVTIAAMQDPRAFPDPARMDPTRPRDRYLHFGSGIHECAGRLVNAFQIPLLVGMLLRAGPGASGPVRFDGPFPDELIVNIARID